MTESENKIEQFAYTHPVYSRKEILQLIKECFPNRRFTGMFEISASTELHRFDSRLRELGKLNASKQLS